MTRAQELEYKCNELFFCWCADPYHMLSIYPPVWKWNLNRTTAPCHGNSPPQQSHGFVLMVSLDSMSMADAFFFPPRPGHSEYRL